MSALFIPLKREFFDQFADGSKVNEYRIYGPRWNERTCAIGRPVTLSLGYGTQRRMSGVIIGAFKNYNVREIPGWPACFGAHPGPAIQIAIKVDGVQPTQAKRGGAA